VSLRRAFSPSMLRCRTTAPAFGLAACGDGITDPTEVPYGETSFVVIANPVVNDANQTAIASPGTAQSGVSVSVQGGVSAATDTFGVAVLSPVTAGARILTFSGNGTSGDVELEIAARTLKEVAAATDGAGASVMAEISYGFGGTVVVITPSMPIAEVNAALAGSNRIVFLRAGTYSGDLAFSGSNVTLYGEGATGGTVTIDGSVIVNGSQNRIRGARITGDLTVPGSDFGMSFSRVAGEVSISGSNIVLLNSAFCDTVTISGSGSTLLGNAGLAPIAPPAGGC
jgi:hypothetical protein